MVGQSATLPRKEQAMPLLPKDFDLLTGQRLPSLSNDYDEDSLYTESEIESYGEELRLNYIRETAEKQAAKAKEAYAIRDHAPVPDPTDDRAVKRAITEPPPIQEPKRLKNQPPPVWSRARGQWTPTHIYGKNSYHYAHLYRSPEENKLIEAEYDLPLPCLSK
jgi:hypothetical protein